MRGGHIFDTKQANSDAEFALRQLLDANNLAQVFQIQASEGGDHVQLNAGLVGISLRGEVEPTAAEVPHAANFLKMPAFRVSRLHINQAVNLNARLATPFKPVRRRLSFSLRKDPLFQFVHHKLPQGLGLFPPGNRALSYWSASKHKRMFRLARRL